MKLFPLYVKWKFHRRNHSEFLIFPLSKIGAIFLHGEISILTIKINNRNYLSLVQRKNWKFTCKGHSEFFIFYFDTPTKNENFTMSFPPYVKSKFGGKDQILYSQRVQLMINCTPQNPSRPIRFV